METQQSYKFLTDLGLAQYDATVRQYMEQTFAKKGETPSGSGVNVVEATLEPGEKEEDWKISEMSHTPDQIWDMFQTKQAVVIQCIVPEEGTIIFTPLEFVEYQEEKTGKDIAEQDVQGIQGIQGSIQEAQEAKPTNKVITFTASFGLQTLFINIIYHKNDKTGEYQWDTKCGIENIEIKPPYERINWQDLKNMRDKGELIPGRQYCIDDYEFSCSQYGINSGNHSFGIIVTADDYYTLNENARAIDLEHNYFQDCNLNAWELKYCLDNDIDRFDWASSEALYYNDGSSQFKCPLIEKTDAFWAWENRDGGIKIYTAPNPSSGDSVFKDETLQSPAYTIDAVQQEGKGVIYWMRDEWGNEAPYDFKNALFDGKLLRLTNHKGTPLTDSYYTFSINGDPIIDASILKFTESKSLYGSPITKNNIITPSSNNKTIPVNIFFANDSTYIAGVQGIIGNEIGIDSTDNLFFENCTFNKLGTLCRGNKFSEYCKGNIMHDRCYNITLGPTSNDNIFKGYCYGIQGITIFRNCEFGANTGRLSFDNHTPISDAIVGNNVQNIDPTELWYDYWEIGLPKFIGLGNDGKPHCVQGIDGFGGGGNTAPLSVTVYLDGDEQFVSADHYFDAIYGAITKENRPVFMHVYVPNEEILFLQLSKIYKNEAWFSNFLNGVYYECKIAEKPAECYFTQDAVIENISKDIKDLDTRVTVLEGGEKLFYDVDLQYNEQTVFAIIQITGEEPPAKASGTTWTAQIAECNDFPELVGIELTGTGSDIETATFTGYDAQGKLIEVSVIQYPKYAVSISNEDTGAESTWCLAELINTRQDETEGWLYEMRTRECPEYPELVRDGFMLKNPKEDKIDNATGDFTTDKGEELSLSIRSK